MTKKEWKRPLLRILSFTGTKLNGAGGEDGIAGSSSGNPTS